MSPPQISRSSDLQRLRDEGYEITIKAGHLLMMNVPYVNSQRQTKRGVLVSDLTMAGNVTARPGNHVAHFVGEQPCHKDGTEIEQIKHQVQDKNLGKDLVVNRSFSNKPKVGYVDYYEKMVTYATIIAGPAEALDQNVTPKTFRAVPSEGDEGSVFNYLDTATTRAGIGVATGRLADHKVGIIGLGGSGSYVLDLVAKCPVAEIHLFDGDKFLQHNAFRAPGAPSLDELQHLQNKAEHFSEVYSRMHRKITCHSYYIDTANVGDLRGLDFVFVCVDKGSAKKTIVDELERNDVRFVDVGIGILLNDEDQVLGILRVTTNTPEKRDHFPRRVSFADTDGNDEYSRNIQIADLNCLVAALAVLKWKKLCGFYQDCENEHNTTYSINVNLLLGEDTQ